jgi:hypothetical protein
LLVASTEETKIFWQSANLKVQRQPSNRNAPIQIKQVHDESAGCPLSSLEQNCAQFIQRVHNIYNIKTVGTDDACLIVVLLPPK